MNLTDAAGIRENQETLDDGSMEEKAKLKAKEHGPIRMYPTECDKAEEELQNHGPILSSQEEFIELWSIGNLSQDHTCSLEGCPQLERRWMLWHMFMKEYSCLDDWLRGAEKLAASPNSSHVPYIIAKEELQKFESLHTEARKRLAQLDSLNQRSCILLGLFSGPMRTRLVDMTRECDQRWDQLSTNVDSVCRRLKHFVHQREEFERQKEEMSIWLADMDLRLAEVEHYSGSNTCDKMRQLQGFQEAVAESAGRLNALLQQGEELIQKSEPADAQLIESQLQELLLYCGRVFQGLGQLHTRLLSMRLVFEDDWAMCPDSGCPSETLEEGIEDQKLASVVMEDMSQVCQEQLVLEWDPSVDIGGSVFHDHEKSSSVTANKGIYNTDELFTKEPRRRRAQPRPVDTCPAMTIACVEQQVTECGLDVMAPIQTPVPDTSGKQFEWFQQTSTPASHSPEPVTFDTERISAWLVQTPRLCSRAVQTDNISQCSSFSASPSNQKQSWKGVERAWYQENAQPKRLASSTHAKNMSSSWSCDLQSHPARRQPNPQVLKKRRCSTNLMEDCKVSETHGAKTKKHHLAQRLAKLVAFLKFPVVFCALLVLLFVLVFWPTVFPDKSCHKFNSLARSFHLALRYVNGPPPT